MEKINTEILVSSLFTIGFDKVDAVLFTYTLGQLSIDNQQLQLFEFEDSEIHQMFNKYVDYDGIVVKYLPKDFNKIKHAFIISIHKSQGSEFEMVIIPISKDYRRMLYRKLIYTAITRAKKKLILIGEAEAFIYSVSNNYERIRHTNLKDRLTNMYN